MKDYGIFNEIVGTIEDKPVAKTKSYGIFDEIVTDTPSMAPSLTKVTPPTPTPVKPTFKNFSDLTFKEQAKLGTAKVTKGWYEGSLGAVADLINAVSTGKDFLKGAFTTSTVSEELAKDTTFDKNVKKLANLYSNQADITSDELKNTKISLGLNPEDTFVDQLLQGTGYLTNFIATGVPTKMATVAIGFGKYAGAVANSLNIASESLMGAQDVYKEAKANGKSDTEAYEAARNTLASNALLIGLTNKVSGIFEDTAYKGIKRLFKVGASGTIEGMQEWLQQMVSNYNTDKPLFQGVKDSFLIGASLGVPMAVAFDTGTKQGKEEVAKVIEQSDTTPEQKQLATDILEGVATEEQKQEALLNAVTNNTFNIPVDETNKESLKEDVKQMIDQGVNTGDLVIALQAEGISQQDAENIVAEVVATPEQVVAPVEEVKVEVTPTQRTKEQIMEDETVPEARKKAISEIDYYLGASEAGYRAFTLEPDSYDYKVTAVPSTFPQWVPENMRSRKVFDQLQPYWDKQERPSNRTPRLQALYDLFQERVNEAQGEYQKKIDEEMTQEARGDGLEFKTRKTTATREMAVLDDFKKRYKVQFPTLIVSKIIEGKKTELHPKGDGEAEGATDGNTIALAFDAIINTGKHELIHLTLNNLDQIPELAKFSRQDILKAQAKKMGVELTKENEKTVEEQLALDFEAYQNKTYKPNNSTIAKFFASIRDMINNFRGVIVKSDGDVITQYYDAVLYGETARKQEVAITTESNVARYLIDNVLDYRPMYQTRRVLSLSNGITSVDFKGKEEVDPLLEEASKYNSAEEFVTNSTELTYKNLQENPYSIKAYGKDFNEPVEYYRAGAIKKNGDIWLTDNQAGAQQYSSAGGGTKVGSYIVNSKKPLIIDTAGGKYAKGNIDINKILTKEEIAKGYTNNPDIKQKFIDYAKNNGYDAVQFADSFPDGEGGMRSLVVWDKNKIKTKSQLTDIWNKAQETKSQPKFKDALNKSVELYKESGDLTTKILKDLEGKTTVSKQYILDATNRGDIKQAERDLIRDLLFYEGKEVNVTRFAEKVKFSLLPLAVNKVETGMGDIDQNTGKWMKGRYENITLPKELRGKVADYREKIYESPIQTKAGDVHFNGDTDSYFGHTRIEDLPKGETRRVIEVQSDLFQKGRLEDETFDKKINTEKVIIDHAKRQLEYAKTRAEPSQAQDIININNQKIKEAEANIESITAQIPERNKELERLTPYRNTFWERLIREEVRQATIEGKTRLQFPTGETAMKIEGLGTREDAWAFLNPDENANETYIYLNKDNMSVGMNITDSAFTEWVITDVLGDGKFKAVQKDRGDFRAEEGVMQDFDEEGGEISVPIPEDIKETFDISGKVDTNNPIYKFYEKDVARYLKNNYKAETVTDEQGVTWNEIKLNDSYKGAVLAFKERVTPEQNREEARKMFPRFTKLMEERKKAQQQVFQSEQKKSRAFERARGRLQEQYQLDTNYDTVKIVDEMAKAFEVLAQNPEYAKNVALGLEMSPRDVTDTAISLAVAETAKESGDYKLQADSEVARSLRQSRRGQEIVMEKGRVNENSSEFFIKQVLNRRKELVAQKYKPFMQEAKPFLSLLDEVKEKKMRKNNKIKSELEIKIEDLDSFLMDMAC